MTSRTRRIGITSALAASLLFVGGAAADGVLETGVGAPQCEPAECEQTGGFTPPFSEPRIRGLDAESTSGDDGAESPPDNPLKEIPDDARCAEGPDGELRCKPAAGSLALLPDGRLLFFNALEGTENVEYSIFLEAGSAIVNDQSRVMGLDAGEASFVAPRPVDAVVGDAENDSSTVLPDALTTAAENDQNDAALFCSDLVTLPDGRVLAMGGTDYYHEPGIDRPFPLGVSELEGVRNARLFHPEYDTWTATGDMHYGRWYPTAVSLANGDVFVASGVTKLVKPVYPDRLTNSGRNVVQTETYDRACGRFRENGDLASRSLPLYPRLHLLPNGHVYYNAAGQAFNPFGQAYDQALWNVVAAYDPEQGTWSDLGFAGFPLRMNEIGLERVSSALDLSEPEDSGGGLLGGLLDTLSQLELLLQDVSGELVSNPGSLFEAFSDHPAPSAAVETAIGAGFRGSSFSIMLPLRPDEDGRYRRAEFLTAGGVLSAVVAPSPGSYLATRLSRIDTVQIEPGGELAYSSRLTGALQQPRWYGTGVLLPNGRVMAFSGANRDEVVLPGSANPVTRTESFDPESETWTPMATQGRERTYHNTALLLPDGRVLVGGHAPINTAYLYSVTLPGFSPNDGRDPSFEIYSPPYVFAERPRILSAPGQARLGQTLEVAVDDRGRGIESVVLVRRTDITHLVDADQRSVRLPVVDRDGAALRVRMPSPEQPAVLPPGHYMLFVNAVGEGEGAAPVPSESVPVTVTRAGPVECPAP